MRQFIRRGLTRDCVEDLVQEALLRVLRDLDRFRGESRLITWATAVTIRTGMELIRKEYWKTKTLEELNRDTRVELSDSWESRELAPDVHAGRKEALSVLSDAINERLTDRQRTALLAELTGMPMTKIGEELGITRNAVYKLTHDARKKLRSVLSESGLDESAFESLYGE